jgi:hypothetical protein
MTPMSPNQGQGQIDERGPGSVADELHRESDRLRYLAETLKAREQALAEMEVNYPHFRQFVYAKLRQEFARTLEELPDKDLETLAQEEDAQPLEAFIKELEQS